MSFSTKFYHLIYQYISTVTYFISLNGSPYGTLIPQHGLKQDGPFSTYLFLLTFECFSRLIFQVEGKGILHSIKIDISFSTISYLINEDDLVIFTRDNVKEVTIIQLILKKYCLWFMYRVNLNKSMVYLSSN